LASNILLYPSVVGSFKSNRGTVQSNSVTAAFTFWSIVGLEEKSQVLALFF